MKVSVEYNSDNIDDIRAQKRLIFADDMASAIFEIRNNLKKQLSYRIEEDEFKTTVFDEINILLEDIPTNIIM